jgi:hypothetical protein
VKEINPKKAFLDTLDLATTYSGLELFVDSWCRFFMPGILGS